MAFSASLSFLPAWAGNRTINSTKRERGTRHGYKATEHPDPRGDDAGYWNISRNSDGMMGYRTPNIDCIANEGVKFTNWYGQQSCTAGRVAFITGQNPLRTGLTKVGLPGSTLGLQGEDPTIAELLKPLGYATGQFGKNHLGDRNEFFPTAHGFDEFFGNLYHLNAEEDPDLPDYPKDPAFRAKFGPKEVLNCKATATENPLPPDTRFGPWGKQTVEDTGPLTIERMGSIRGRLVQLQQVLGLADESCVPALRSAGNRGSTTRKLCEVPAPPEGCLIQP